MEAPSHPQTASVTWKGDVGRGDERSVRGPAVITVPSDQSLVVIVTVSVQDCCHLVYQSSVATANCYQLSGLKQH